MAKDDGVMDVSKPGKTPAEPSARPIIVKSGRMVQDPTLKTDNPADLPDKEKNDTSVVKRLGITVKPLGAPKEDEKPKAEEPKPAIIEAPTLVTEPKPAEEEKPKAAPEEDLENISSSSSAEVSAIAEQANAKKTTPAQIEEDKKKAEAIEKMIEEKKYFVKIGQPKSTKSAKMALVVFLVIVLAVVGFDLAVDAGLLEVDFFTPPVDLIKN